MVLPSARASFFQRRPLLLFPVFYGLLIPLLRKALGFLQTLPQSLQQTTHMSRVVADSKGLGYALLRPSLSSKALRRLPSRQSVASLESELSMSTDPTTDV